MCMYVITWWLYMSARCLAQLQLSCRFSLSVWEIFDKCSLWNEKFNNLRTIIMIMILVYWTMMLTWGGYSQKTLGGTVWLPSQNPCSIYGQNARLLPPCFWPGQKFDSPFMTIAAGTVKLSNLICLARQLWRAFVDGRIDNDDTITSSKKHAQFKTRVLKPYPI